MRASHLATLIGMSAALAACGTQNRGVESVHQPVVSKSNYVLDVNSAMKALRLASPVALLAGSNRCGLVMATGYRSMLLAEVTRRSARPLLTWLHVMASSSIRLHR